jgi:hypothetical protein
VHIIYPPAKSEPGLSPLQNPKKKKTHVNQLIDARNNGGVFPRGRRLRRLGHLRRSILYVVVIIPVTMVYMTSTYVSADAAGGKAYGHAPGSANGPENWGKLSPENKMCWEGKRQSPVDIVTKQAVPAPNLDTLARTYAAADATLINNGHNIAVRASLSDGMHASFFSEDRSRDPPI